MKRDMVRLLLSLTATSILAIGCYTRHYEPVVATGSFAKTELEKNAGLTPTPALTDRIRTTALSPRLCAKRGLCFAA